MSKKRKTAHPPGKRPTNPLTDRIIPGNPSNFKGKLRFSGFPSKTMACAGPRDGNGSGRDLRGERLERRTRETLAAPKPVQCDNGLSTACAMSGLLLDFGDKIDDLDALVLRLADQLGNQSRLVAQLSEIVSSSGKVVGHE